MRGADRFYDRESQARPSGIASARFISTVKPLEDVRQRLWWNTRAVVGDSQGCPASLASGADGYASALAGIADRIVEEVHQHLLEAGRIALHFHAGSRVEAEGA